MEELIWISSSQLEGAGGPDRRDKVHHDKEVRRRVPSQGASGEGKKLALSSVLLLLSSAEPSLESFH